jgi:DNA-binding beta-propeller fold protein YncE
MAKYKINIQSCDCGERICPQIPAVIEDNSNQLVVGNVYTLSGVTDCDIASADRFCVRFGCYTVTSFELVDDTSDVSAVIINSYGPSINEGCENCNTDNSNFLIFVECFRGFLNEIAIPIDQISPTPTIGDTFYLELAVTGFFSNEPLLYNGCFTFDSFATSGPSQDRGETFLLNYTTQTDCETCSINNSIIYEGTDCLTQETFYVALPSSGFDGHLITYTDLVGLTQYCGIINGESGGFADALFVSDLGLPDETGVTCEDCLSIANEKKELINCLTGDEEIVWSSVLFEPGDSTHLSFGEGCYEISPNPVDPDEPITISELANFDPQEDCEDCLECYGVIYNFVSCEELEVCGPVNLIETSDFGIRDFKIDTNDFAFVPFRDNNRIAKIDLNTQTVVELSSTLNPQSPQSLDIDEANGVICVSNTGTVSPPNYTITFFDYNDLSLSVNTTLNARIPWKVYFNPNDNYFYVTTKNSNFGPPPPSSIFVYSGNSYNTMSFVGFFGSITQNYSDIIQIGSLIYVLNESGNTIEIYNDSVGGWSFVNSYSLGISPISFSYDGVNTLYILTNTNNYIKFDITTNSLNIINYFVNCFGSPGQISFNSSTNRLYITDTNCNIIYEFDTLTDSLLNTYNNLSNNNVSQVYGIDVDSSGNTWFGSYSSIFQLGCTNEIVSGKTTSNTYLSAGTTFFNYQLSACCEITNVSSITESSFLNATENISLIHYDNCETCTGITHELFLCYECNTGLEGVLVAEQGTYSPGNFVRSQFGNSDFACFEIIEHYTSNNQFISFIASGPSFTSCEECQSGATLGLTLINLNTLNSEQVNVTLNDWFEITGFPFGLPNQVISDANGVCHQVVNSCPIDNVHPEFEVKNFYFNQLFCRIGESIQPEPPRSANTEVFICIPDCYFTGSTAVTPPHPVWTDGYGTPVTQLNMVTIGGNGLNG